MKRIIILFSKKSINRENSVKIILKIAWKNEFTGNMHRMIAAAEIFG